jgi:hypothetical protein
MSISTILTPHEIGISMIRANRQFRLANDTPVNVERFAELDAGFRHLSDAIRQKTAGHFTGLSQRDPQNE